MDLAYLDIPGLINAYGLPLIFFIAFASCLALPVPASLVFMTAGTFAAGDQLSLHQTWLAGFSGAVLGDQTGYHLARLLFRGKNKEVGSEGKWKKGLNQAR